MVDEGDDASGQNGPQAPIMMEGHHAPTQSTGTMDLFIQINNRYIPLHTIVHIDDEGAQLLLSVRDARTGPGAYRLHGEAADRLRDWLAQHTAVSLTSQSEPQDTGYRDDD